MSLDKTREMAIRLCEMVERMAERWANDCEQFAALGIPMASVWRDRAVKWHKRASALAEIRAGLEVGK